MDIARAVDGHQLDPPRLLAMEPTRVEWHAKIVRQPLIQWTAADVATWLEAVLQLPQCAESFATYEMDGAALADLDKDKLLALEVPEEAQQKILAGVRQAAKVKASDRDRLKTAMEVLLTKELKPHMLNKHFTAPGARVPAAAALSGKVFGLYFSAHWCAPCQKFTPLLVKAYEALRERGIDFEVVYVSSDKSAEEFDKYFDSMPWLALPFEDRAGKELVGDMLEIRGLPTLVLVAEDGTLISMDGVRLVLGDKECKNFPWTVSGSVPALMTKLQALKTETYSSSSLALAVERGDNDDTNGEYESIQLSGTCYFRCVLTCFKYMLKADGLKGKKAKSLFHLFRIGFLDQCLADLTDPVKCKNFQDSDRRMIEMGCSQTALSAVKEFKRGSLDAAGLQAVQDLVDKIMTAANRMMAAALGSSDSMWLKLTNASATVVPYHGFDLVAGVGGTCAPPHIGLETSLTQTLKQPYADTVHPTR